VKVTPLISAVNSDNVEIAKLLIDAGADLNVQDIRGNTALLRTLSTPYTNEAKTEIAKLLIDAGADLNVRNKKGKTALMLAIENKFGIKNPTVVNLIGLKMIADGDFYESMIKPDMKGYKHGRLAHKAMLSAKYPDLSYYDAIKAEIIQLRGQASYNPKKIAYLQSLIDRFDKTGAWKKAPSHIRKPSKDVEPTTEGTSDEAPIDFGFGEAASGAGEGGESSLYGGRKQTKRKKHKRTHKKHKRTHKKHKQIHKKHKQIHKKHKRTHKKHKQTHKKHKQTHKKHKRTKHRR
jgi:hypothetical protein